MAKVPLKTSYVDKAEDKTFGFLTKDKWLVSVANIDTKRRKISTILHLRCLDVVKIDKGLVELGFALAIRSVDVQSRFVPISPEFFKRSKEYLVLLHAASGIAKNNNSVNFAVVRIGFGFDPSKVGTVAHVEFVWVYNISIDHVNPDKEHATMDKRPVLQLRTLTGNMERCDIFDVVPSLIKKLKVGPPVIPSRIGTGTIIPVFFTGHDKHGLGTAVLQQVGNHSVMRFGASRH